MWFSCKYSGKSGVYVLATLTNILSRRATYPGGYPLPHLARDNHLARLSRLSATTICPEHGFTESILFPRPSPSPSSPLHCDLLLCWCVAVL